VIEVTPAGKIVWSIEQNELPGITLAWVTTLQVLPSGNIIIGNTHAGESNPQLFEVTKASRSSGPSATSRPSATASPPRWCWMRDVVR
jgi:hypothetical protein